MHDLAVTLSSHLHHPPHLPFGIETRGDVQEPACDHFGRGVIYMAIVVSMMGFIDH